MNTCKKEMMVFNVTPINTDVSDLKAFETKVIKAKELGATHIVATEVIKNRWLWEEDLSDPYPNWGMLNATLFKIIIPDKLKPFLNTSYAEKNLELLKQRSLILKKHGLKAAAQFCEPFYLPEAVYQAYPSWRGPRCDHPRRSKKAYYTPCIDNEEVLSMYKESFQKLCEVCDIEYVFILSNDSGSGLCWSNGLYVGANGPIGCKNITQASRLLKFFNCFKEAALATNKNLAIEINSRIGVKEIDSDMENVWKHLGDNMAVNSKANDGNPLTSNVDVNYEFTVAPIRSLPIVLEFLELLEKAYHEKSKIIKITLLDVDFDLYSQIIKEFKKSPTNSIASRFQLLLKVGNEICDDCGANLVNSWWHLNNGLKHLYSTLMEGFTWVSVNQRLINRPFVLLPNELSFEEKSYYRPYQFQATTEEDANDLLNNQGSGFVKGYYAVFLATKNIDKAIQEFQLAIKEYEILINKKTKLSSSLTLAKDRIELLIAFCINYKNAMLFQQVIDETDFENTPILTLTWPQEPDSLLYRFEIITRAEIDNTYKLINLLKDREREMLVLATTANEEDVFWLTPNIVSTLEKKASIMWDRIIDGKKVYKTGNK